MPSWFSRDLGIGDVDPAVELLRRKLGLPPSQVFDVDLELHVRAVQKAHGLPATGFVDAETAEAVGEGARQGLVPDWFERELSLGTYGADVAEVRYLLGLPRKLVFDAALDNRVRRFQSRCRITPNGVIDERTAILIGDDVPSFR
jgi:murein L,D-transpeptidase YcbB/YkuD